MFIQELCKFQMVWMHLHVYVLLGLSDSVFLASGNGQSTKSQLEHLTVYTVSITKIVKAHRSAFRSEDC